MTSGGSDAFGRNSLMPATSQWSYPPSSMKRRRNDSLLGLRPAHAGAHHGGHQIPRPRGRGRAVGIGACLSGRIGPPRGAAEDEQRGQSHFLRATDQAVQRRPVELSGLPLRLRPPRPAVPETDGANAEHGHGPCGTVDRDPEQFALHAGGRQGPRQPFDRLVRRASGGEP